ncbi:4'-phosphopantetheinyl transferase superfamily protein [Herbaspirillum rhizosphaerae]|uniref:4'-phosphopantetheinyl transferase superfamily protein n=1 Tax=Herbaspirillum rhizosphaerae TaxID=346179 RepID=A0ABW8ZEX9_9BURK
MPTSTSAATLWLLRGDVVSEARLTSLAASLGQSECERYGRFLRPQRAREFLLGRMLLRHAVQKTLGIATSDIIITEREGNAPLLVLPPPHASSAFYFSLSHSHGWIGCVSSIVCPVGLDIEDNSRPRDVAASSAAVFDEAEQRWLAQLPDARRKKAFYRLWNCKEALYKLRCNSSDNSKDTSSGHGWNCRVVDHPHLSICLCFASPLDAINIVELDATHDLPSR